MSNLNGMAVLAAAVLAGITVVLIPDVVAVRRGTTAAARFVAVC